MSSKCFNIHTHIGSSGMENSSVVSIQPNDEAPAGFLFSVGVHPWALPELDGNAEDHLASLAEIVACDRCVAVGECGFDRPSARKLGRVLAATRRDRSVDSVACAVVAEGELNAGLRVQSQVFDVHVEIAETSRKPLIIHCVRAFQEIVESRKNSKSGVPWIIHGFRGAPEVAASLVANGFHLSFGRALLARDAAGWRKLAAALSVVPMERLLLETDDVEPPPTRIDEIVDVAAEIKKVSPSEVAECVTLNARSVFNSFF